MLSMPPSPRPKPSWFSRVFVLTASMLYLGACSDAPTSAAKLNGGEVLDLSMPADGVYDNASDGSPVFPMVTNAKRSLDIEIYEMNDPKFRANVIAAKKRGVAVRIVIEPQPVGVCNSFATQEQEKPACTARKEMISELETAGITVVPFAKELCAEGYRCYQHGKLVIADGATALMSTGNFNSSSFCNLENSPSTCNRDYTVVTRDSEVLRALQSSFDRDVSGAKGAVMRSAPLALSRKLTVSPVASKEFLGFIAGAQKSLKIQAQYLKEPSTNEAILRAAKRGVKVQATIASNCSFTTYLNEADQAKLREVYQPFIDAGVELTFFTKKNTLNGLPAYMHAKLMIADDARAWVGSINGSATSLYGNREYGMFFEDANWVAKLTGIFGKDFSSQFNEAFEKNLTCENEKSLTSSALGFEESFELNIDADMN